jgi:hypothetical protein
VRFLSRHQCRRFSLPQSGHRPTGVPARADDPRGDLTVAFLIAQQLNLELLVAVSLTLALLASASLSARFRRPIRALVDGARRLGAGRLEIRLAGWHRPVPGASVVESVARGRRLTPARRSPAR